jgi:16S rRNA (cytidine1402-2'-O)-methyltransferase
MEEKRNSDIKGVLYVVSTPIGNLEDMTLRALSTLRKVDLIAAEDTRRTRKLLAHYQIKTPVTSYFEYNERNKSEILFSYLRNGKKIALVSDAGTPGISDPGYRLISKAIENHIAIVPVPGVSSVIAALSVSGLATHSFLFKGFIPPKRGKRRKIFDEIKDERVTIIFYESPRRLIGTLEDLLDICGERKIVIAREITKVYEEIVRGRISEVLSLFKDKQIKGEVTIMLEGSQDDNSRRRIKSIPEDNMPL